MFLFDQMQGNLLNVSDTCPQKTAKLSGEVVWAADGGLSASRHGVPSHKTMPGNGAQQLLPGRGSPSPTEVIPCVSMELELQSQLRHKNVLCIMACKVALHAAWSPARGASFSVR